MGVPFKLRTVLGTVVVVVVLASACTSDSGPSGDQGGEGDDAASDQEIADAAIRTIDDFPAGWREVAAEDAQSGDAQSGDAFDVEFPECEGLEAADEIETSAEACSSDFQKLDAFAGNQVAVYASIEEAEAVVEAFRGDEVSTCFEKSVARLVQNELAATEELFDFEELFGDETLPEIPGFDPEALEDLFPSPEDVEATAGRLSVDEIGDETVGYEAIATLGSVLGLEGPEFFLDVIVVRVGRTVTIVQTLDFLAPQDLTAVLAETATERLEAELS